MSIYTQLIARGPLTCAYRSIPYESTVTFTRETSIVVNTGCILIAGSWITHTLVDILTYCTISSVPTVASAYVAAKSVRTICHLITIIITIFTFIDICTYTLRRRRQFLMYYFTVCIKNMAHIVYIHDYVCVIYVATWSLCV